MTENKAYAPPRKARMNVGCIMQAIKGSGHDGLQAANAFSNAEAIMSHRQPIRFEDAIASIVAALDTQDDHDLAVRLLYELRSKVNGLTTAMRRSLKCIESGVRWHTGLHVQPGTDPLRQR